MLLILVLFSMIAIDRNKVWKDEFTLWADAKRKSPALIRPYNNLGQAHDKVGNYDVAYSCFEKSQKDSSFESFIKDSYLDRINSYKESIHLLDWCELNLARIPVRLIREIDIYEGQLLNKSFYISYIKRFADIIISISLLALTLPLIAISAIFIKNEDRSILRSVATDGHRLAKFEHEFTGGDLNLPGIIIPKKTMR